MILVSYEYIISVENLLLAWQGFRRGKRSRKDVQEFELRLMDNIISLHKDLKNKTYSHGGYQAFNISDPKPRNIHKASVRDRVLHHALYQVLYFSFDKKFIFDSYSCRREKGTHKALYRFEDLARKVSKNNICIVWVSKCDIRKFFASIDQKILIKILTKIIKDEDILWLLSQVIVSFNSGVSGVGLPLGNLTSQLLVNIYMNEFDQFVKHKLKAKYYIRYADDFVILSQDRVWLENILSEISQFLRQELKLNLHPNKVFIKTVASGVDFLGWVHFPHHRVLRTSTKRRMFQRLSEDKKETILQSYLGLLAHGDGYKISQLISQDNSVDFVG